MKYPVGLAVALVASALILVAGVGRASATVLCGTNTSPCTSIYPTGTETHSMLKSGTKAKLSAGFAVIECGAASTNIRTTSAGGTGSPVNGVIAGLSFSECGSTVKVLSLGSGSLTWTSGVSGSLTESGTRVEIVVGATKCIYGGEITSGFTLTGGAPATMSASNVAISKEAGGVLCANPARYTAEYTLTGPSPLYVEPS